MNAEKNLMDDVRMPWLEQSALLLHADRTDGSRQSQLQHRRCFWETPAKLIWEHVKALALKLGVSDVVTTLYAFRHVGPSRDQLRQGLRGFRLGRPGEAMNLTRVPRLLEACHIVDSSWTLPMRGRALS